MMNSVCIEPRLIDLEHTQSHYLSLSLPPLPEYRKTSGRPLPLEPVANFHVDIAPILSIPSDTVSETPKKNTERALGSSSPQSLRKILDNSSDAFLGNGFTSSKRKRNECSKEGADFVQLPQPPKPLKQAKQAVPPIIIGLHDVPPQQTLFPPIASSAFHDSHGRNTLNIVSHLTRTEHYPHRSEAERQQIEHNWVEEKEEEPQRCQLKPAEREKAVRRKFTDEETRQLLLGVKKHGIGKWAIIVKDSEFTFNSRTAVDLKDRFRVICPTELGGKPKIRKTTAKSAKAEKSVHRVEPLTNINTMSDAISGTSQEVGRSQDDHLVVSGNGEEESNAINHIRRGRKVRKDTQRKDVKELADVGIDVSTACSRQTLAHFTEIEDRGLLRGFEEYGNKWAIIQKDARFGLQKRSRCDLRDRMRSKYPEKLASIASKLPNKPICNDTAKSVYTELTSTSSQENVRLPQPVTTSSAVSLPLLPSVPYESNSQLAISGHSILPPFPSVNTMPKDFGQLSFSDLLNADIPVTSWNEVGPVMLDGQSGNMGDMNIANLLNDECFENGPYG